MKLIKETRLSRFLLWCILVVGVALNGRTQSFAVPDSLLFLSQDEFLNIVRSYHPVVRQANLLVDRAAAELIAARAGFDPLLYADGERKTFDGKNYYNIFNPELKVPTWYGIEFKAGLEENYGDNLNNSIFSIVNCWLINGLI